MTTLRSKQRLSKKTIRERLVKIGEMEIYYSKEMQRISLEQAKYLKLITQNIKRKKMLLDRL